MKSAAFIQEEDANKHRNARAVQKTQDAVSMLEGLNGSGGGGCGAAEKKQMLTEKKIIAVCKS